MSNEEDAHQLVAVFGWSESGKSMIGVSIAEEMFDDVEEGAVARFAVIKILEQAIETLYEAGVKEIDYVDTSEMKKRLKN